MDAYFGHTWLVRLLVQRGMAALYFVAFLSALNQFRPLLGERGLLPVPRFLARVRFRDAPSVFHFRYSDRVFSLVAGSGVALSLVALSGLSERGPFWLSIAIWLVLYALYLSIVNVGQDFYAFGWESMLLEAGFFTAFLGPRDLAPSLVPVLALRWMLFRTEVGAGLIKLRHDPCWRDLTCLYYHHETQPMPNRWSIHFHRLPKRVHRAGVVFSHFAQVVAPFGLFAPQPIASAAGVILILHQSMLVASGNYAWLNWLTIVLGLSAFDDRILSAVVPFHPPALLPRPVVFDGVLVLLAIFTLALSVKPAMNLLSKRQAMNASYNPFHLLGSYGAFGSVTRKRYEVIVEGTMDSEVSSRTVWREYELKGKPGDPRSKPRQWAPYHLRLDWLMWFLPLRRFGVEPWFIRLVEKLLAGDPAIRRLLRRDPFDGAPPRHVRARLFHYRFATREEQRETGEVWRRSFVREYLPVVAWRPSRDEAIDDEDIGEEDTGIEPLVPAPSR
jgi:hypothetical protein